MVLSCGNVGGRSIKYVEWYFQSMVLVSFFSWIDCMLLSVVLSKLYPKCRQM